MARAALNWTVRELAKRRATRFGSEDVADNVMQRLTQEDVRVVICDILGPSLRFQCPGGGGQYATRGDRRLERRFEKSPGLAIAKALALVLNWRDRSN
jgi:hypothetical protein